MADIIEIGVALDSTEVANAVVKIQNELKRLERATKASADVRAKAEERVYGKVAINQINEWSAAQRKRIALMDGSARIAANQAREEAKVTAELVKQRDAAEKLARANAQRAQASINSSFGIGSSATSSGAGFGALEGEMERLVQKFDKVRVASQLYEQELRDIQVAHANGVISAMRMEEAVESLTMQYQRFQDGVADGSNIFARMTGHVNQTASRANQLGVVIQQTGYQVGDFLVQVQSGTNWMVAFGQQATQLVGTLPLLAESLGVSAGRLIAISTGLGIAIPLVTAFGAYFMRTAQQSKESSDKVTKATSAINQSLQSIEQYSEVDLFGGMVASATLIDEKFRNILAVIRETDQILLNQSVEQLKGSYGFEQVIKDYTAQLDTFNRLGGRTALDELLGINQAPEIDFLGLDQIHQVKQAYAAILEISGATREELLKSVDSATERLELAGLLTDEMKVLLANMAKELDLSSQIKDAYKEQADAASGLRDIVFDVYTTLVKSASVNLANVFSVAKGEAAGLLAIASSVFTNMQNAANAQIAFNQAQQGLAAGGKTYSGRGGDPRTSNQQGYGEFDPSSIPKTGSSGGGGGNPLEAQLESIRNHLQSEAEAEMISYQERQDSLKAALDQKMITLQEYQAMEKELTAKHNEELSGIDVYRYGTTLQKTGQFFEETANAMQAGGEKTLRIQKTFAAASALINAYEAGSQVLRDPTLPWYAKVPAALSIIGAGVGFANAIKGGGGSGGGRGSRGRLTTQTAATPAPQTVYLQGLDPGSLFSGQQIQDFFKALYKEGNNRGMNIVVAR